MLLSPFEWTIAKRYLLPGKGEAFIALVASISIGVVMLSVAMLVIVMSVMNGFRAELLDKIVGLEDQALNDYVERRLQQAMRVGQSGGRVIGPLLDALSRFRTR